MRYCPRCGREVREDYNYCPYCGFQLKTTSEAVYTWGGLKITPHRIHPLALVINGILLTAIGLVFLMHILSSGNLPPIEFTFILVVIILAGLVLVIAGIVLIFLGAAGKTIPIYGVEEYLLKVSFKSESHTGAASRLSVFSDCFPDTNVR